MEPAEGTLATKTEESKEIEVAIHICLLQIVEQRAPLADHLEQAATGVVVVDVSLEMGSQILNACRQQRHLYLRRTGITIVTPVFGDDFLFFSDADRHLCAHSYA